MFANHDDGISRLFFLMALVLWLILIFPQLSYAQKTFATAKADQIQALTNQHSTLTSTHFAFIFNDNNFQQGYNYTFELCSALQSPCTLQKFTVYLNPHVSVNIFWNLILDVLYTQPGDYVITATTTVTGPNTNVIAIGKSVINIIQPFSMCHGQGNTCH